jgi:predicted acylesterase/phospholipase RssA
MQDIDNNIEEEINKILKKNNTNTPYNKKILVLSGGGSRGLVYTGVFKALDELGILENIHTFSTASVGSLICSMYLIGYTVKEIEDFVEIFDFKKFTSIDSLKDISPNDLFINYGFDNGENIHKIYNKLLKAKGLKENISLLELYEHSKKKIIFSTTCLNTKQTEYVSYETHPDLRLTDGIRMTTAVPLYFTPVLYNNNYYADGGCTDNYPISIFKDNLEEVIGVYVYVESKESKIENFKDYLYSVFRAVSDSIVYNSYRNYEKNTILIHTNQLNFMNFELTKEDKLLCLKIGYEKIKEYFLQNN